MSNTENVKLGVCRLRYDGVDLGYTKGGVEVTVKTNTHQVMIDQFGSSAVNELIMGRVCSAKVPLAETTLDNLARIMPGTTVVTDGAFASGSITISSNPANGDKVTANGVDFVFKTSPVALTDVKIGATAAVTTRNLAFALQSSTNTKVNIFAYTVDAVNVSKINLVALSRGAAGNAYTLTKTGTATTVTVPTGGVNTTKARIDVTHGIGISLLKNAKELVLHPIANADNDHSEDFIMPKAATAGGLNFAYKVDQERVFDTEFNAYPDVANGNILFQVGDKTAESVVIVPLLPRWFADVANPTIDAAWIAAATPMVSDSSNVAHLTSGNVATKAFFIAIPQPFKTQESPIFASSGTGSSFANGALTPVLPGGWGGIGLAGSNDGSPAQADGTYVEVADANGVLWRIYREDYVNTGAAASLTWWVQY